MKWEESLIIDALNGESTEYIYSFIVGRYYIMYSILLNVIFISIK